MNNGDRRSPRKMMVHIATSLVTMVYLIGPLLSVNMRSSKVDSVFIGPLWNELAHIPTVT
jgi:hypothetical protein